MINDNLEPLLARAASVPMFFLCGSGISIPSPAELPSAPDMIKWTASILQPEVATEQERQALKCEQNAIFYAPPEIFYQALYDLVGPVAVHPWSALSLHDRVPQAFPSPPGPTLGHLVLTYLSWRNHVPIVTTNFDSYFEAAADKLGVKPIRSFPQAGTQWKEAATDGTEVAIWKIHGSADCPESICTTLDRISMSNWPLLERLKPLVEKHRACLLGYSGRDIDCFPFVANFASQGGERIFWINRSSFSPGHRIFDRPERFIGVRATIDNFAEALLSRLDLNSLVGERLKAAAQECFNTTPQGKEDVAQVYSREVERIVSQEILPELRRQDIDLRPLLHASALASIHMFEPAARYCEQFLKAQTEESGSVWVAQAWIILASCYHNLSKYKRSEEAARHALRVAKTGRFTGEAIYALSAIDEAMRMQLDLDVYVKARPIIGTVKTLRVAAKSLFDLFRLEKWAGKLKAEASSTRVIAEVIEHRIRLYAIPQGILFRLGALRIADWLLRRQWRRIRARAYDTGYTAGIANAEKFMLRAQPNASPDALFGASANQVFDLMKHNTGLALMQRDRGLALVAEGNTAQAVPCFERARDLAHDEGNSSLELKAILGLSRCGQKVDVEQARALVERIENDAQERVTEAVMKRISRADSAPW